MVNESNKDTSLFILPSGGSLNAKYEYKSIDEDWPEPKSFDTVLYPVQPLMEGMIPKVLRPWLTDIANRMKCPIDYVAVAAVVMLSSLIGTRLAIKPKSRDDWTVVPNLWGAVIGEPSSMKTPSVAEVFKPLDRLIIEQRDKYEAASQAYEAEQASYEVQRDVFKAQEKERLKGKILNSSVSYPEAPKKPVERRYMTNDATVEKLADLLNNNPTGLLQFRDEVIGLLASFDRAGHEQDRAFYLEAWNGTGGITIDRIGRGTIHVDNVCLSLFGGIQPSKLLAYLQAAASYENDGFVQRIQLGVYPDSPHWEYTDEYPDKQARSEAYALIGYIANNDFRMIGYEADEYNKFSYTRFDPLAQEIFKNWLIKWESKILPAEGGLLLEHFTKYRSLMPALALIFHAVNSFNTEPKATASEKYLVSEEAAQMAICWCEYLQSHARRIYGLLDTVSIAGAKELLRHIKADDLKDGFKARTIQQKGWSNLTTSDSIEAALTELVDRKWLREISSNIPTIGRPEASHYFIHPKAVSVKL